MNSFCEARTLQSPSFVQFVYNISALHKAPSQASARQRIRDQLLIYL